MTAEKRSMGVRPPVAILVLTLVAAVSMSEAWAYIQDAAVGEGALSLLLAAGFTALAILCVFVIVTVVYMMDRAAGRLNRRLRMFERLLETGHER
jgi:hypothetical protein